MTALHILPISEEEEEHESFIAEQVGKFKDRLTGIKG